MGLAAFAIGQAIGDTLQKSAILNLEEAQKKEEKLLEQVAKDQEVANELNKVARTDFIKQGTDGNTLFTYEPTTLNPLAVLGGLVPEGARVSSGYTSLYGQDVEAANYFNRRYMRQAKPTDLKGTHINAALQELNTKHVHQVPAEGGATTSVAGTYWAGSVPFIVTRNLQARVNAGEELNTVDMNALNTARDLKSKVQVATATLISNIITADYKEKKQAISLGDTKQEPDRINVLKEIPELRRSLLKSGLTFKEINDIIILATKDSVAKDVDPDKANQLIKFNLAEDIKYLQEQGVMVNGELISKDNIGTVKQLIPVPPQISRNEITSIENTVDNLSEGEKANHAAETVEAAVITAESNPEIEVEEAVSGLQYLQKSVGVQNSNSAIVVRKVGESEKTSSLMIGFNPNSNNTGEVSNILKSGLVGYGERDTNTYRNVIFSMGRVAKSMFIDQFGVDTSIPDDIRFSGTYSGYDAAEVNNTLRNTSETHGIVKQMLEIQELDIAERLRSGKSILMTGINLTLRKTASGFVAQARQAGFMVEDDGSFTEYLDAEGNTTTDEELYDYLQDKFDAVGFSTNDSGEINVENLSAYYEFLKTQLVYTLARQLENPTGAGARLSVTDITMMEKSFGTAKVFDNPERQYNIIRSVYYKLSSVRDYLKMKKESRGMPFVYAMNEFVSREGGFQGFDFGFNTMQKVKYFEQFAGDILQNKSGVDPDSGLGMTREGSQGSTDDQQSNTSPQVPEVF